MKNRLPVVFAVISMLAACIAGSAANVVVRHYGTADGMTHTRVRDILQDSTGYMWFATWCGVERFDGYEFRNFRTYSGDSIKLDNNRIEHIAISPGGHIAVETYGHRIYRLDPVRGLFSPGSRADSLALAAREASINYTDRQGNRWIIRDSGVDHICGGNPAFNFINSAPIDSIGEEIHAIYAAPDGMIWAAARDTRVMLYDSSGEWLGNLSSTGEIVKDTTAGFGRKAYAFHSDSQGRLWIGTKSKELDLLTPDGPGRYRIRRFTESRAAGGLACADIYAFATDRDGNLWLGTFGKGVAKVIEGADGNFSFHFPASYPVETYERVRRLAALPSGLIVGATTHGVIAFDPSPLNPDDIEFSFTSTDVCRSNSLSNDDILDICLAADNSLYFSAFTGGIDQVEDGGALMDNPVAFNNKNIRDGLNLDLVLSVIQDSGRNFWVVSPHALSLYSEDWQLKSTYNSTNLGHKVRFTEAQPQKLADGRLIFGRRGGIVIVDPARLSASPAPPLVVTAAEAGGKPVWPHNNNVRLPEGVRDITLHLTAIDFNGAENIRYAYRTDDETEWIDLDGNRVLRLSSLGAGSTAIELRSTDANGVWADNSITLEIDVPRTSREIAEICLIIFSLSTLVVLGVAGGVWLWRRWKRRRRLAYYIKCVLSGQEADEADLMTKVCHIIRQEYGNASLKAENVAQRLDVGRNVLRREVKARIGISLEDFLRLARVHASAKMLRDSSLTISEVAYSCGFKSPQYMSMVFKEHMGCSPTEYAGRHRKKS